MKIQKLVRDKIPDIIKKSGRVAQVQRLDEKEYYAELQKKLTEEVNEFLAEPCLAELADITELVHALTKILGYNISDLFRLHSYSRDCHISAMPHSQ